MSYRIAIIGSKEAVAGFALLGVDVFPADEHTEISPLLLSLKRKMNIVDGRERNTYGILFVAEDLFKNIPPEDEKKLGRGSLPAIIPLPSHHGSSGYGLDRLKRIVERAVGSNILQ